MPGVRVDAGVAEGGEVTIHYDPMIAKVIATHETRALALARLTAALRAYPILGIRTNIPFLLSILEHPRFRAGEVDTGFLDGEGAGLVEAADIEMPPFVRAALDHAVDNGPSTGTSRQSTLDSQLSPLDYDPWVRLREWRA